MKPRPMLLLTLLLLLLLAAGWPGPVPAAWSAWGLSGLSVLGLLACGRLPVRFWLGAGLLLGLIALYAWNATHEWIPGLGLLPRPHVAALPGSADPAETWQAFRLALAALAVYALAFRLPHVQIRWLQGAALAAAAGMALAVLFQRLGPDPSRIRSYTGIFVNENHFAVFANLLLPVVLVMASRARFRAVRDGRPSSPAGLVVLMAVLLAAAVVVCRSRAGVAVMTLLVAAHVGLCRRIIRQYPFVGIPPTRLDKWLAGGSVAAALAFAVRAFWAEWQQIETIGKEWAYRSGMLKDALAAWRDRPVWGTGPGTFSTVFPFYQSELFTGRTIRHAHCEPVQFLMEFGVAGLFIAGTALVLLGTLRASRPPAAEELPGFADLERRAFGWALAGFGLHGLIDFPLRIPLLALLATAWAGLWVGTRPPKGG